MINQALLPLPALQPIDLDEVDGWLDRGLFLRVHAQLEGLRRAGSVDAQVRIARALRHLGAERDGCALAIRLGRRYPQHLEATLGMLRARLSHGGPYSYFMATSGKPSAAETPEERARALSLHGAWLVTMRDFGEARRCHSEALALCANDPWLWVEHSYTLERQDAYAEAEAAARQALDVFPGYRAATQQLAHLLVLRGEREQALDLLTRAADTMEAAGAVLQLHGLLADTGQHERALHCLARFETLAPLLDAQTSARIAALRADRYMALDRLADAREQALKVPGTGFYSRLAERLADQRAAARRVLLPVNFVRQHWNTCAPATLASLVQYWGKPADHLEIAQAICYDGTPAVAERRWAQDQGLIVREFRLDWDSARALLDRGVPFSLATQFAGSGHLQAVVGYDELRGTLWIRDPYEPTHTEFDSASLLDGQQSSGPRAMLLLPTEERHRLAGVSLPEVEAWDRYHALQAALQDHQRATAEGVLTQMRTLDGDAPLRWRAERTLAIYDGDEPTIVTATEALLQRFPDDVNLQLSKASSLGALHGQAAVESYLESLVGKRKPEPLVLIRLASRLAEDGRRMPRALSMARRAVANAPARGLVWGRLASMLWNSGEQVQALPLYRWASCLAPTDEDAARSYARACHFLRQGEQGITFLRERERDWGDRSGAPAISLFEALDQLEHEQTFQVLRAALARRPLDAELKIYAAEAYLNVNQLEQAERLLEEATAPAHPASLLRVRALIAERKGDVPAALGFARESSLLEPLNVAHRRMVMRLLERQEGKQAAIRWLECAVERHPGHYELRRLLYGWLDDGPASDAALIRLHELHPADPWTLRERASMAARRGRLDEAEQLAREACLVSPGVAASHGTLAFVLLQRDGYGAAQPHLCEALRLDVDYTYALDTLISAAPDHPTAKRATEFVVTELLRQVTVGDGLLCFQRIGERALPADELAALLAQAHRERPDLWQSWLALSRQQIEMDLPEQARALLVQAGARFPSLPAVQLALASALQLLGNRQQALREVEQALAIAPGWNPAVRMWVELTQELDKNWIEAERVIRRALAVVPGDEDLIGLLAWVLEEQERPEEALAEARRALMLNPKPAWIWRGVRRVASSIENLALFDAMLDDVAQGRPGDAWAWTVRAQHGRDDQAALTAAEQAIDLEPRLEEAWLARFERLARLSRHADIEALLADLPWPDRAPLRLRSWGPRCAWHRQQRSEAIASLRKLLEEAPNDEQLWRELADWLDVENANDAYERAARELVRLSPNKANAHGYLGHALVKLGQFEQAVPSLRRALEIEPDYAFAAEQLCKAALACSAHDAAFWGLETHWPHQPGVQTAALAVELACAAQDRERALHWLTRLFTCDDYEIEATEKAIAQVRAAGWSEQLSELQLVHLRRGDCPPGVGMDYLKQTQARMGVLLTLWRVRPLLSQAEGPSLLRAVLRWLLSVGYGRTLRLFVYRHRVALARDEETWGEVSYALVTLDYFGALRRWMADWRSRAQAPVWALHNLCLALAVQRDWATIGEIVARALPRSPYNDGMRLWQLAQVALHGSPLELKRLLSLRYEWTAPEWMVPALESLQLFSQALQQGTDAACIAAYQTHGRTVRDIVCRSLHEQLRWRLIRHHTPWSRMWRWLLDS